MEYNCVLPPNVCGHPTGELTVKVDEIFWSKKSPGIVFVHLQWWGEDSYNMFWPSDLNQKNCYVDGENKSNTVSYTIKTSTALFQTYIRNCRELTFYVVKECDRTIVGTTVIKNLSDILIVKTYSSFSSYYPIYNLQKNRIGDLRISFALYLKPKSETDHFKKEFLPKRCPESFSSNKPFISSMNKKKAIAQVVSKGQELRKAMVKSVLKDCSIDQVENIIDVEKKAAGDRKSSPSPINEDAHLVDFIIGKNLSNPDSNAALKTLDCLSSSDSSEVFSSEDKVQAIIDSPQNKTTEMISSTFHNRSPEIVGMLDSRKVFPKCNFKEANSTGDNKTSASSSAIPSDLVSSPVSSRTGDTKAVGKWIGSYQIVESVDCFRFTVNEIKLNDSGAKKVCYTPTLKPTNRQIRLAGAPGTLFSIEFTIPVRPSSRIVRKPTVFISKKFHGKDVTIANNIIHKLPSGNEYPWLKVSRLCGKSEIKVYWRHLNQRRPSLLGSAVLPEISNANCNMEQMASTLNLTMPIISNGKTNVGSLTAIIELGRNSKSFGEQLFNPNKPKSVEMLVLPPSPDVCSIDTTSARCPTKEIEKDCNSTSKYDKNYHLPIDSTPSTVSSQTGLQSKVDSDVLRVINLLNKKLNREEINEVTPNNISVVDNDEGQQTFGSNSNEVVQQKTESKSMEIISGQEINTKEHIIDKHQQHSCCCCCKRFCHFSGPNLIQSVDKECSLLHEFTITVHKVCNFPLFTRDQDMDCFVDYKFPYVSPVDATLSMNTIPFTTETTIALRNTHFSTSHSHKLKLLKSLSESLVTLHKEDLVFRLWGRLYQPVPRDHKLAKAKIPLSKLTLLEYKFEQGIDNKPVNEILSIPLELVRSSLTSRLHEHGETGSVTIGIQYRRYPASRAGSNEARNYVASINKLTKYSEHDFDENNSDLQKNCEKNGFRRFSPVYSDSIVSNNLTKHTDAHHYNNEIPEQDAGLYPERTFPNHRDPMCTKTTPTFDTIFHSKHIPSHDYIDLVESPPSIRKPSTNLSPSSRSQCSEIFHPQRKIPPNVDSPALCDNFSTQLHNVEIHQPPTSSLYENSIELYSSQNPLQMKKDLSCDDIRLSEEFEVFSEPSFLAVSSSPKFEKDFPAYACRNLDITSATDAEAVNPFDLHLNSANQTIHFSKNCNIEDVQKNLDDDRSVGARLSMSVAVETESQVSDHKSTQTSSVQLEQQSDCQLLPCSVLSDDWFMARICIEKAINLPMLPASSSQLSDNLQLIKPSTYVQFRAKCGNEIKVIRTNKVQNSTSPIWDSSWQLQLPTSLLYKNDEDLELYVGCSEQTDPLGKVYIDLTTISAGLPSIEGWFSISDGIRSTGQIKVSVTALEDVSRFKERWLKEYSKKGYQSRKYGLNLASEKESAKTSSSSVDRNTLRSSISSSIGNVDAELAESLRSKISEMELITEQIRKKMSDKSSWENSPPNLLLERANNFLSSLESSDRLVAALRAYKSKPPTNLNLEILDNISRDKILADTGCSPIVISDDEEKENGNLTNFKLENTIICLDSPSVDYNIDGESKKLSDLRNEEIFSDKMPVIDLTEPSDSSQGTLNRLSSLEGSKAFGEDSYNTYLIQEEKDGCSDEDSLEIVE